MLLVPCVLCGSWCGAGGCWWLSEDGRAISAALSCLAHSPVSWGIVAAWFKMVQGPEAGVIGVWEAVKEPAGLCGAALLLHGPPAPAGLDLPCVL